MRAAVIMPDTIVEKRSTAITAVIARPTASPKRMRAATEPIAFMGAPSGSVIASGSIARRYARFTPM